MSSCPAKKAFNAINKINHMKQITLLIVIFRSTFSMMDCEMLDRLVLRHWEK